MKNKEFLELINKISVLLDDTSTDIDNFNSEASKRDAWDNLEKAEECLELLRKIIAMEEDKLVNKG